jgi:putative redox protein
MSDRTRTATLRWSEGLVFEGGSGKSPLVVMDGDGVRGPSPMELLLLSLGGCMAIDLRVILERSRVPLDTLDLVIEGDRVEESPRRYESIRMVFRLSGPGEGDRAKVQRALDLSTERYCSVHHTLRPDLSIQTSYELI